MGTFAAAQAVSVADTPASQLSLTGQAAFHTNATLRLRMNALVVANSVLQAEQFQTTLLNEISTALSVYPERLRVTAFRALEGGTESRATVMFDASRNASDATPEQLIVQLRDVMLMKSASLNTTAILQHVNASSMVIGECPDAACLNEEDIPPEDEFAWESCMKKDCYWMIPFLTIFLLGWIILCAVGVYYCGACRRAGEPEKHAAAEVSDTHGGSVVSGNSQYARPTGSRYSAATRSGVNGSGSRAQPPPHHPDSKSSPQAPHARTLKPRLKSTLPPKELLVDGDASSSAPLTPKKDDFHSPSQSKRFLVELASSSVEIAVQTEGGSERTETPVIEIEAGGVEAVGPINGPNETTELVPRPSEEEDKL
jgi:hypothetical protein